MRVETVLVHFVVLKTRVVRCCGKRFHAELGKSGLIDNSVSVDGRSKLKSGFASKETVASHRGTVKLVKALGSCSRKLGKERPLSEISTQLRHASRDEEDRIGTTKLPPRNEDLTTNDSNERGSFETNVVADIVTFHASKWLREGGSSTVPSQSRMLNLVKLCGECASQE